MPPTATQSRPFKPGTTGWTASDLDDPRIERHWMRGAYEIVEGVLTTMPPAYFAGGNALFNLLFMLKTHLKEHNLPGRFATEVDIIIDETRVAKSDAAMLLPDDEARQAKAARRAGKPDPRRTRIYVPPALVIESLSPGHELHDTRTKKRWYAEFRVPHYWLLDAYAKTLQCLVLNGGRYRTAASGRNDDNVPTTLFPGLGIPLSRVWSD